MRKFTDDIRNGRIISAYALDPARCDSSGEQDGVWQRAWGVKLEHNLDPRDLFAPAFGDIIAEVT